MNSLAAVLVWQTGLFALCASVRADPQLSATATLLPASVAAGETATFQFTIANADIPEGSDLSASQLAVQWTPSLINGVSTYFSPVSISAPGGGVSFITDPGGNITGLQVSYGPLAKGASRSFGVVLQIPNAGLANGSSFQASGTLTWAQAPGTLTRSASCTLQAAPSLVVSLAPVPLFTAPGGLITWRTEYWNAGSGIARKAWMVVPVPPKTDLYRVSAVAGGPEFWFSTTSFPLASTGSDEFIRSEFTPGTRNDAGTPEDLEDDFWVFPPGSKMMAILLDDPDLHLLPAGGAPRGVTWQVEDRNSPPGTVIEQTLGIFSDEWALTQAMPRQSTIAILPTAIRVIKFGSGCMLIFAGDPEKNYQVERSGNLSDWAPMGQAFPANPGFFQYFDSSPLPSRGFYRISSPE